MRIKANKRVPKTRKQRRKDERKQKKDRKNEWYMRRSSSAVTNPTKSSATCVDTDKRRKSKGKKNGCVNRNVPAPSTLDQMHEEEVKRLHVLQSQMRKQRSAQLEAANREEDKTIKSLEKLLKLKRKNRKKDISTEKPSIHKSFIDDGLDYVLEMCDPDNRKEVAAAEKQLEFTDDEIDDEFDDILPSTDSLQLNAKQENSGDSCNGSEVDVDDNLSACEDSGTDLEDMDGESEEDNLSATEVVNNKEQNWEDIYGRQRTKDGTVIEHKTTASYVPPALRKESNEKSQRLVKQIKGLLNRLAESNMHRISTDLEGVYMSHSRNEVNETLTNLMLGSVSQARSQQDRLLLEHALLIAILHANVGTEVGAYMLERFAESFTAKVQQPQTDDPLLINIVLMLSYMYHFRIVDALFMFDVLNKLRESSSSSERHIECILHILKTVGFLLRKDDPLKLRQFIIDVQQQHKGATLEDDIDARFKFMLDILMAIKNNNCTKIPNYDLSYAEHLKKLLKTFVRKGNSVAQLNISLQDVLNAKQRGKWWIVGSAWTGKDNESSEITTAMPSIAGGHLNFSTKIQKLAREQGMNTSTRYNIFGILMTAEDYEDAYVKLLKLNLKGPPERDIIYVVLQCCMNEPSFNPYYAALAFKFCQYKREFQLTIRNGIWDKLKVLNKQSALQISNLSRFVTHLILEQGLSITVLDKVQFSELDEVTMRFVRQVLFHLLLHDNLEVCQRAFEKIASTPKLKMFRESLRLFIHHFVLRNAKKSASVTTVQYELLEARATIVDKLWNVRSRSTRSIL